MWQQRLINDINGPNGLNYLERPTGMGSRFNRHISLSLPCLTIVSTCAMFTQKMLVQQMLRHGWQRGIKL